MARKLGRAPNVRAMRDIESGLKMLTLGLRQLAGDVKALGANSSAKGIASATSTGRGRIDTCTSRSLRAVIVAS